MTDTATVDPRALATTEPLENWQLANSAAHDETPIRPIESTPRPIFVAKRYATLSPESQEANRHAFADFLRRPDVRQIRGPLAGWVEVDGTPEPAFCLMGAYSVWRDGGYYLSPSEDDSLPTIYVGVSRDSTTTATLLGIPSSEFGSWVDDNDYGKVTFAEFADRLDAMASTS